MEKVTITIEGTSEEVVASLHKLVRMPQQRETGVSWLPREIEEFFYRLQPEAQRILREIATRPQGYHRDELISNLGISGRGLAGRLSSIGHNMNRDYPMKPKPIELDFDTWQYKMLPEFVDWITSNIATD